MNLGVKCFAGSNPQVIKLGENMQEFISQIIDVGYEEIEGKKYIRLVVVNLSTHLQNILFFDISQKKDIFNEFSVNTFSDLFNQQCFTLEYRGYTTKSPLGIKKYEESEYIEVKNEYLF